MEYNHIFVCLMGMGTVFFGLICLIVLTEVMHRVCGKAKAAPAPAAQAAPQAAPVENREELLAAISAAVAEQMGTTAAGIRIVSFKKV